MSTSPPAPHKLWRKLLVLCLSLSLSTTTTAAQGAPSGQSLGRNGTSSAGSIATAGVVDNNVFDALVVLLSNEYNMTHEAVLDDYDCVAKLASATPGHHRALSLDDDVKKWCGFAGTAWDVIQTGIKVGEWLFGSKIAYTSTRKCKHWYSTVATDGGKGFTHRTRYASYDHGAKAIMDYTFNFDGPGQEFLPFDNEFAIPGQLKYAEVMFDLRNCVQEIEIACNRDAIGQKNNAVQISGVALEKLYASQGYTRGWCGAGNWGVQTATHTLKSLYLEHGAFLCGDNDPKCVLRNMRFQTWEENWSYMDGRGYVNTAYGFTMNDCNREYHWKKGKRAIAGDQNC